MYGMHAICRVAFLPHSCIVVYAHKVEKIPPSGYMLAEI